MKPPKEPDHSIETPGDPPSAKERLMVQIFPSAGEHERSWLDMEHVRTVFVSDLHLGCKHANASAFLHFLKSVRPQHLYLVGDILDGWKLKRRFHWPNEYNRIVKRLLKLMKKGTRICYTPGNHDDFLRNFIDNIGGIEIKDEFIHTTVKGEKILVLHGDQFDGVVRHIRWLSHLGDFGYEMLLLFNKYFNVARKRLGFGYWSISAAIKRQVKRATSFISSFETMMARHAQNQGCDGVLCGHIHTPAIRELRDGFVYYNTGDWVESCTAIVEDFEGNISLVQYPIHLGITPEADKFETEPDDMIPAEFVDEWRDPIETVLGNVDATLVHPLRKTLAVRS